MARNGGKERESEKKRLANRANARKPRRKFKPCELENRAEAREWLSTILPLGTKALAKYVQDAVAPNGDLHGGPETWVRVMEALNFAADRAGLPRLSEQRVMADSFAPIVVTLRGLTPPWLEATGSMDARGDRHDGEPQHLNGNA